MNLPITTDMSYEQRAKRINQGIKERIIKASDNMAGKLHPQESDVVLLFEMFHEYITHYPLKEKLNCNDCRVMIRDFWQRIVNESWKK